MKKNSLSALESTQQKAERVSVRKGSIFFSTIWSMIWRRQIEKKVLHTPQRNKKANKASDPGQF